MRFTKGCFDFPGDADLKKEVGLKSGAMLTGYVSNIQPKEDAMRILWAIAWCAAAMCIQEEKWHSGSQFDPDVHFPTGSLELAESIAPQAWIL